MQHGIKTAEQAIAEVEEARVRERIATIPVVTLQHMPGHKISRVAGIITSEVVLGTGLMTEVSTKIVDFFGIRGTMFEEKWRSAKEAALRELRKTAYDLGCNAVLGVDVELAMLGDIPMFIVTGTGVVLDSIAAEGQTHASVDNC